MPSAIVSQMAYRCLGHRRQDRAGIHKTLYSTVSLSRLRSTKTSTWSKMTLSSAIFIQVNRVLELAPRMQTHRPCDPIIVLWFACRSYSVSYNRDLKVEGSAVWLEECLVCKQKFAASSRLYCPQSLVYCGVVCLSLGILLCVLHHRPHHDRIVEEQVQSKHWRSGVT
jgi:hypothetical protein